MTTKIKSETQEMISLLYVPIPDRSSARSIGRHLIERRLALCVNIIGEMESIYEWQGKVEHLEEILLIIKVNATKIGIVKQQVEQMHPYQAPFIGEIRLADINDSFLSGMHLVC
jgi:periplasmic divalent cation tolerance protein